MKPTRKDLSELDRVLEKVSLDGFWIETYRESLKANLRKARDLVKSWIEPASGRTPYAEHSLSQLRDPGYEEPTGTGGD